MLMTCHIQLRDGTHRRVELDAPNREQAVRQAFAQYPAGSVRAVCPRVPKHDQIVLQGLGEIKAAAQFLGIRS